jgi:FtsP/CotA-like multicopper oxidase with cupredoxin domain
LFNTTQAIMFEVLLFRYRFRLINMACDPGYLFSINNHNLTVIEADGNNVKPHTVDSLTILAGEHNISLFF